MSIFKGLIDTAKKHKEIIPLLGMMSFAGALASSYSAWKLLTDNQILFDRSQWKIKNPCPQIGNIIFGRKPPSTTLEIKEENE